MFSAGCFKKFCKRDKSLEDDECSGWPSEVDNDQLRAIIKTDPLTTTWGVAKEPNDSVTDWHLKQIGKVKKLYKWVPHELIANQKIILKCHLPIFCAKTMNHFTIGLWHAMKSGFYMTTGDDQLSGWTEKKFQSTCIKRKIRVTVWWSAAGLIHYSFLNPGETITSEKCAQQINEMHWNLQCLQLASVNRKGPILLHENLNSI